MKKIKIRGQLVLYDALVLLAVDILLLCIYRGTYELSLVGVAIHFALSFSCIFLARCFGNIYNQIWRYGGVQCYIKLILTDAAAFVVNLILMLLLPIERISFFLIVSRISLSLICGLMMRMAYRYAYKCETTRSFWGRFLRLLLKKFAGKSFREEIAAPRKTRLAII